MKKLLRQGRLKQSARNLTRVFGMSVLALLCVACSQTKTCAVFSGAQRSYCELQQAGVPVQRVGQTVRIVLPSDRLFVNETSEINPSFKPTLDTVANFIGAFSTIDVKITAHVDKADAPIQLKSGSFHDELARLQAAAVERYLAARHVNTRLLYGVSRGDRDPIAWAGTSINRALNRRVEIIFRFYKNNKAWY